MAEDPKVERKAPVLGDRVVIWADGKEVADGRLEAWILRCRDVHC